MSSTRLPGKVMRPILGEPMIARQVERLRRAQRPLRHRHRHQHRRRRRCARGRGGAARRRLPSRAARRCAGALRRARCAAAGNPKAFVRLTADCPLADWRLIDRCIETHAAAGADYTHNSPGWTFPKGLDVEVCRDRRPAARGPRGRRALRARARHPLHLRPSGAVPHRTRHPRPAAALSLDRRHARRTSPSSPPSTRRSTRETRPSPLRIYWTGRRRIRTRCCRTRSNDPSPRHPR